LVLVCGVVGDAEVAARLHRGKQRARVGARIGREHRGRQALRVGVDRVAEEDELQHRDADDHAEGQAVALELDELLDDDPDPARPREAHCSSACTCSIRWMKTSSSPAFDLRQRSSASSLNSAIARSSSASFSPVTCSVLPKAVTCATPALPLSLPASSASFAGGPDTSQVASLKRCSTSSGVPVASSFPSAMYARRWQRSASSI